MDTDTILATSEGQILPRLEKKARQTLAKLGLKKVEGINRVVLRRPQGVLFIVAKPEVYRAPGSDCYIVFGDAKYEDPSTAGFGAQALAAAQAAEQRQKAEKDRQAKAAGRSGGEASGSDDAEGSKPGLSENELFSGAGESSSKKKTEEPSGDVDATGVDENDIKTVMDQTKCSKGKAIQALKENNGDILNAIMAATS